MDADTVAAPATPIGGARAAVRLSGPRAFAVASSLVRLPRRRAVRPFRRTLYGIPVRGMAWAMPGPASFTGEDSVEFHVAGSPPIVAAVMRRLAAAGARPAAPGEFTRRAFLNGKIDLAQAEAVLATIQARTGEEAQAAAALAGGAFSRLLGGIEMELLNLCADLEAAIDFVDQDIEIVGETEIRRRLQDARSGLFDLAAQAAVRDPAESAPVAVLVGPPNAGKSTLFNALTGGGVLTGPAAGTTRDLLEGRVGSLRLFDAPGLEPTPEMSILDREACRRAREQAEAADLWIVVRESGGVESPIASSRPHLDVVTKIDQVRPAKEDLARSGAVAVSAVTGEGLPVLLERLERWTRLGAHAGSARFLLSRRQAALLDQAVRFVEQAAATLDRGLGLEFTALDVRSALESLGAITGRRVDEAILDRVFERFCLGK